MRDYKIKQERIGEKKKRDSENEGNEGVGEDKGERRRGEIGKREGGERRGKTGNIFVLKLKVYLAAAVN